MLIVSLVILFCPASMLCPLFLLDCLFLSNLREHTCPFPSTFFRYTLELCFHNDFVLLDKLLHSSVQHNYKLLMSRYIIAAMSFLFLSLLYCLLATYYAYVPYGPTSPDTASSRAGRINRALDSQAGKPKLKPHFCPASWGFGQISKSL